MSLGVYDKSLMEMVHSLTKKQEFMDSLDVARYYRKSGRKVSDRTVRRWFHRLEKGCFDYYPYPKHESMGLQPIFVRVSNPADDSIMSIIPHMDYISCCYDRDLKRSFLLRYQIPRDSLKEFEDFWARTRKAGLVDSYEITAVHSPTHFYSPFHRIIKKDGQLDFSDSKNFDNSYFKEMFNKNLARILKPAISTHIIENPLIVPALLEFYREHYTNRKAWKSLKKSLGAGVWKYLKNRRKQTDGVGYYLTQRTVRALNTRYYNDFFNQITVFYDPWMKKAVTYFLDCNFSNKEKVPEILEEISKKTLVQGVYPKTNGRGFMIYHLTNGQTMNAIVRTLRKMDPDAEVTMLLRDPEESSKYFNKTYLKMNYTLFNPETLTWAYDHEKYLKALESLKSKELIRVKA